MVKDGIKVFLGIDHQFIKELVALYINQIPSSEIQFINNMNEADILLSDVCFLFNQTEAILDSQNEKVVLLNYTLKSNEILILLNLLPSIKGIIDENMKPDTLYKALVCVDRGEIWIRRSLLHQSLVYKVGTNFSPKELKIIWFILQGKINKEIARELDVSEQTVKYYINSILSKIGGSGKLDIALRFCRFKDLIEVLIKKEETVAKKV
ncbi:two-component system, NarL family, nitrate/nitrite response regulator NarP [Balnearium lithotrophicum]|uniref:Two-component system, NarL family, nitrate/nitrite response regulator NarP n=1 Tax=Balnearium lithotrophicum TaxID=223788 RepID=A0A521EE17_9BACT|nr:LuxR C-terminal-related transcriptional regulator [Balnearium lithotrophicum]SMO82125.1 two-component system, NarL family, nitrate/nitrite response regulator NarP [Balnearium lithotrophicum]